MERIQLVHYIWLAGNAVRASYNRFFDQTEHTRLTLHFVGQMALRAKYKILV